VPRPRKPIFCRTFQGGRVFKPSDLPLTHLTTVHLALSELEAMRLCDLEGCNQSTAGLRMGISRGTVQRLLSRGRSNVVKAIIESSALLIGRDERDEDLHTDVG